jgi:predicted thioesterase
VSLAPGLQLERQFDVDDRLLTDVGGTLATPVLSTPGMIATLREVVDGRKLFFDVEVVDGDRVIGVGTHQRRIVDSPRGG